MNYAIVRYTVKPQHIQENLALVREVLQALEREKPPGISYMVLATEGGEFVHIAGSPADDPQAITRLPAFQAFTKEHAQRRASEIERTSCQLVGAYRPG